jgi:CDP-glucose 4,6-dehydratase
MGNLDIFWKHKKVLITGHTGFKGSWLSIFLKYLGAEVYGISREEKKGVYAIANLKKLFEEEFFLDISDNNNELDSIFSQINPDIVFHFAAQSLVIESYINPLETLQSNIIGSYNILDTLNRMPNEKTVVVATTDKVYKTPDSLNIETSELGGKDFYSASKVGVENIVFAFLNKSFNNDLYISSIRSGNVIGGGERADNRLITDLVSSMIDNMDFHLRMPNSIRPWQYVLDSIYGYLLVAKDNFQNQKSEIYNLNSEPNNKFTSKVISELLIEKWNSDINIITDVQNEYEEVGTLKIDSSKAKQELGWKPLFGIEETIEEIVSWEKYYRSNTGTDFCFEAVERYTNKLI